MRDCGMIQNKFFFFFEWQNGNRKGLLLSNWKQI